MKKNIKNQLFIYTCLMGFIVIAFLACDNTDYALENRLDPIEQLTIVDISPAVGDIGTYITVNGTNFSATPSNNKVSINGVNVTVDEASATSLTIIIPEGATSGNIVISHGDFTANGPAFTVVDVPTISDVDPAIAGEGDVITITGTKFNPIPVNNTLTINGIASTITDVTETSITTSVPSGSVVGVGDIIITVNGQTTTFSNFTVIPVITAINPAFGAEGDTVTITGTGYSTTLADNTVEFNGTMAIVSASTTTSITVTTPVGGSSGAVRVTVNEQTVIGPDFTFGVAPTTLIIPLDSEDDDAEEVAEADGTGIIGDMDLSSSDLEFGEISSDQGLQNIGLRFNNLAIPKGVTITNAKIQFKCDDDGSGPVEITVFGEAVDNATTFTDTNGDISSRPLTTASAVWNIEPWLTAGDRLEAQQTVDLSSIIQEIIDRPSWTSGNSISFIMKHTGVSVGATSSSAGREAENYSSSTPDDGAELTVSFN